MAEDIFVTPCPSFSDEIADTTCIIINPHPGGHCNHWRSYVSFFVRNFLVTIQLQQSPNFTTMHTASGPTIEISKFLGV